MKNTLLKVPLLIICMSLVVLSAQASIDGHSALIVHAKYIVSIAGCNDCHTNLSPEYLDPTKLTPSQIQTIAFNAKDSLDANKYMAGGRFFDLGPAGTVYSANLTPDVETGIGGWTDEQIKVAIRT